MKHLPAILFIAAAVLFGSVYAPARAAPILDFAVRVGCDFQQPERGLMDLHVLQGSTPLVLAMPKAGNVAMTPDPDTSVRMIIGPSDTGSIYAVRTNYAIAGGGYAIDWPTIGTNSSGQAWFYTLLFDREGKTYWSGSGALYIDASGYSGPDGVDWIEYTTPNVGWQNIVGDPRENPALVAYLAEHGGGSTEGYVPTYRTITINGVAHDLSSDRAWTVECGGGGSGISAAEAGQIATNVLSTATVTNEVDPRRYDAYREYATIDASTGTGTITSASALWLSLPASDEPRTLAMGAGFDAAQAWRFYVQIARGTNSLSIDTNLTGYAFLSLPVSSTNHVLIDRFPGDSSFRVLQVYR